MANCGLVLNDGTSFVQLNAGGFILLNDTSCQFEPGAGTTDGGGYLGHQGSAYWKQYQEENERRKKGKRKKKDALTELDELIAAVKAMPAPQPALEVAAVKAVDIDMGNTLAQIEHEIIHIKALLAEQDEEEALIMLLH